MYFDYIMNYNLAIIFFFCFCPTRPRRFLTAADAVSQILIDSDEDSNIPYGSDDENLTDNEDDEQDFIPDSDTDESDGDDGVLENDTDLGAQSSTQSPRLVYFFLSRTIGLLGKYKYFLSSKSALKLTHSDGIFTLPLL